MFLKLLSLRLIQKFNCFVVMLSLDRKRDSLARPMFILKLLIFKALLTPCSAVLIGLIIARSAAEYGLTKS